MGTENLENQSLTEEELALFLKQIGISEEREKGPPSPSGTAPLEPIPGDILEKNAYSPLNPLNLDLEERSKRSLFPLWASLTILLTFFIGSLFGFFWGHSHVKPQIEASPEKQTEIVYLLHEVKDLCLKILEKESHSNEIIEPLEPLSENERLAPSSFS